MKPHVIAIIQDVIFPLMSYSDADEELWETDPIEYIREKFDVFDDFSSPVPAAETLLHNVCKTRKGILNQVMAAFLNVSCLFSLINNFFGRFFHYSSKNRMKSRKKFFLFAHIKLSIYQTLSPQITGT